MAPLAAPERQRPVVLQWPPHVQDRHEAMLEERRHHADHDITVPVERDLPADDVRRRGEGAPPQPIAQDHDRWRIGHVVGVAQIAAQPRRHAEDPEVIRADRSAFEPFRSGGSGKGRLPLARHGEMREAPAALLEFGKSTECDRHAAAVVADI